MWGSTFSITYIFMALTTESCSDGVGETCNSYARKEMESQEKTHRKHIGTPTETLEVTGKPHTKT